MEQMEMQINWFNPHRLMTYNCLFNFIVGDRGGGKSFGTLEYCVRQFQKYGKEFIYLRRYKEELDDSLPTLFDALIKEGKFEGHEMHAKGKNLYFDGKIMGYAVSLSTSMKRKSVNYSNVHYIIFEEFMVDGVGSRYLGTGDKEVAVFENFYETVDRLRDQTRVFFLANAFSMVNIYFMRYKIRLKPPYKTYNKLGPIMVCIWQDQSYRDAKAKTQFFDIVKGTEYAEHAYGNKFYMDSDKFIRKKNGSAEFHFAYAYMDKIYGVWVDWNKGNYYITTKVGSVNQSNVIALT
ncbi:MAG: hypothetical protein EOM07_13435, partial [Clostridia bacterium]|nr:hypothetical protein [Clostridia bacterium]